MGITAGLLAQALWQAIGGPQTNYIRKISEKMYGYDGDVRHKSPDNFAQEVEVSAQNASVCVLVWTLDGWLAGCRCLNTKSLHPKPRLAQRPQL